MKRIGTLFGLTLIIILLGGISPMALAQQKTKKPAKAAKAKAAAPVLRIGSITGLKPEKAAYYKELHAAPWAGVLKRLRASNIGNYSIYFKEVEGKQVLFSYFEYTGRNMQADNAKIAADAETQRWWKECVPCIIPFPLAAEKKENWEDMEEVFHSDGASDVKPKGPVKRVGSITGLKMDKEAYYRILHAAVWPNVLKAIKNANIRNYSIYLKDIEGKLYLFSYFEYVGENYEKDMADCGKDPVTRRWWQQTDPCQIPFPAAAAKKTIWDDTEEVFHLD